MVRALILDFCEKRNVYTALICELDIRKIMDCFNGFILISKYSRIIPYSEINQSQRFNFNSLRYIDRANQKTYGDFYSLVLSNT